MRGSPTRISSTLMRVISIGLNTGSETGVESEGEGCAGRSIHGHTSRYMQRQRWCMVTGLRASTQAHRPSAGGSTVISLSLTTHSHTHSAAHGASSQGLECAAAPCERRQGRRERSSCLLPGRRRDGPGPAVDAHPLQRAVASLRVRQGHAAALVPTADSTSSGTPAHCVELDQRPHQ